MQEAQEVEVFRLPLASGTSAGSCKASKLNDPSLVGMKLQRELQQPFAKLSQEPLGVPAILEANHKVISKARDDDITPRMPSSPLLNPEIEGVVQVEVRQKRRNGRPLRDARAPFSPPISPPSPSPMLLLSC